LKFDWTEKKKGDPVNEENGGLIKKNKKLHHHGKEDSLIPIVPKWETGAWNRKNRKGEKTRKEMRTAG